MIDKKTKALLLAIALGLWANVFSQWLRPAELHAQASSSELTSIDTNVKAIALGLCLNSKIC